MRVFLLRLQTDSRISMAKPLTMENTGEMVEGKVDNKRKIMKGKILDRKMDKRWLARTTEKVQNKFNFSNISSWMYEAALPYLLPVIQGN